MARFCPLASGSSGNSTYLGSAGQGILVDAGIADRSLAAALAGQNIEIGQLQAVLITHEHTDHVRGLNRFLQRTGAEVVASPAVLGWLERQGMLPPGTRVRAAEGPFEVAGIQVTPFATPHDSVGSLGYRFELPDGRTIGVATDLGYVTEAVERALTGCDLVLLEANYNSEMLWQGSYPYYIKRRICSQQGHLENEESGQLIARLFRRGSTRFVLGHLSQHNNTPALAYEAILRQLQQAGGKLGLDFTLSVAPRGQAAPLLRF